MKNKRVPKNPETAAEPVSLGGRLREARTRMSLSVEQLHERTRVPVESILALEEERFDVLPAPVYTRGFVKLLCRELQLPYEELVALLPLQAPAPAASSLPVFQLPAAASDASKDEEKPSRVSTGLVIFILLVLASLAISYIASQKERTTQNASASETPHIDITG